MRKRLTSEVIASILYKYVSGVWRSLVSRLVRVQEAAGSNPATPTNGES